MQRKDSLARQFLMEPKEGVAMFCISVALILMILGADGPLARTGSLPSKGLPEEKTKVWTNADLSRLRDRGLISIIGQIPEETTEPSEAPAYVQTNDPQWYAAQAARLESELENRQAELQRYRQALEVARDLRMTTGGLNLTRGDIGINTEAGIEILERRVRETRHKLDELGELARHNGVPPGALRGQ